MTAGERRVIQGGRAKAYRPLPPAARRAAFEAGLEAYGNGDFFLAHELLEPAWMGTRDIPERELIQGVIKLAAAYVHAARGNPAGVEKNLRGARARLGNSGSAGTLLRVDVAGLLAQIDRAIGAFASGAGDDAAIGAGASGDGGRAAVRIDRTPSVTA